MATLWGGRFTKEMDKFVYDFNASILFDSRFYKQDIRGSVAHVTMLAKQGILTEGERDQIIEGLLGIEKDIENGTIEISTKYEDVHTLVEDNLIARIGDVGKKLHTGRSRNDQVVTDLRLYLRDEAAEVRTHTVELVAVLVGQMEQHLESWMPGFTHLQKAQPVTLAHHLGAYVEMLRRDVARLDDTVKRMNESPLGAGALAGTSFPLDRDYTARLLGFDRPSLNSMDAVSDRDYVCELLFALAIIMQHLSRLSEEIIIWSSDEYKFVMLDDAFTTGSSIMPQKKNPDIAELIRGKTGRVYGALMSLLTMMKGLPMAFDKDMQEDKEVTFDAIDTTKNCLIAMAGMLRSATFRKEVMARSATQGFINATDVADYMVNKGVPFRDAHAFVGQLVLRGIQDGQSLDTLPLEVYKQYHPSFEEDVYDAISLETSVKKRLSAGSPKPENMQKALMIYKEWLEKENK